MRGSNSKIKDTLSFSTCFGLVVFYGGNREETREKELSKMLCVDDYSWPASCKAIAKDLMELK